MNKNEIEWSELSRRINKLRGDYKNQFVTIEIEKSISFSEGKHEVCATIYLKKLPLPKAYMAKSVIFKEASELAAWQKCYKFYKQTKRVIKNATTKD